MKNFIFFLSLTLVLLVGGCSKGQQKQDIITVTIEPQRYFAEQLTETLYQVECMVAPGISPETYDPTIDQLTNLSHSRAYFCIGHIGFEEAWLNKLKQNNPNVVFYDTSKGISLISGEHRHGDHVHVGIDPHTWTSPKQALVIVDNMYKYLVEMDPTNQSIFKSNYEKLKGEIEQTNRQVERLLENVSQKEFIIYHPALTYFARDYGLTQYAIEIDGKEPSPAQIKALIDTAKEKNIKTVFIQEEFDKKNAELIAKETNCRLVVINPLSYNWSEEIIHIAESLSHE